MHFRLCFSVLALLIFGGDARAEESGIAKDLLGEWKVVAMHHGGQPDSGVSFQGARYLFEKESFTHWAGKTTPAGIAGKPPIVGKYRIDSSKTPCTLDLILRSGDRSTTLRAICKMEDGKLLLCLGRERPTTFATDNTRNLCYTSERVTQATNERTKDD